jgi:predicted MFS family arabinose efflux permease
LGFFHSLFFSVCYLLSITYIAPLAEAYSRKYTIVMGCTVFIIGAAIQTAATGYGMMIGGRFVAGLGVGSLSMLVPLYQVIYIYI